MRIAILPVFLLVSGALSAVAQQPATVVLQAPAMASRASDCPIDMRVRQVNGGSLRQAGKDGARAAAFTARLRLLLNDARLSNQASPRLVEATVTVHGTNGKGQILPADAKTDSQVKKIVTVQLSANGEPEVSGDLMLPGFTSANMVELNSVTYDDGTVRKFSAAATCRVAPERLMEVSGR
jgi:hypothetical protein